MPSTIQHRKSPVFIVKPTTQKVQQGATALFVTKIGGYSTSNITWLFNEKPLTAKEGAQMQFNTATGEAKLSIGNVDLKQHAGLITCRIENPHSYQEETVQLVVVAAPIIITQLPKEQETMIGRDVILTVVVQGSPPPSAQWFFKDDPIEPGNVSVDETKLEYKLLIKQATVAQSEGVYRVMLKNEVGEVQSTPCALTVLEPVKLTRVIPASDVIDLEEGKEFNIVVDVSGKETPEVQLQKDGKAVQFTRIPNIPVNARWTQNGVTVAGGYEHGNATNQLYWPYSFFVDDNQTMVIADCYNHRIIQWKRGETNGQVVAGGHGCGNRLSQLNRPTDVLIDKETDSFIICDRGNRRVLRCSRRHGTTQGEILLDNIFCRGLAIDDQRYLYISDINKHEVRRYQMGAKNGIVVAGGHDAGTSLNQLNQPTYIFVDRQQIVYISDWKNHRVMKWNKDAAEGTVVAGGQGQGNALTQLSCPQGLFVDILGTVYVADSSNHRVMRWPEGSKEGTVIVGGNGRGERADQLKEPMGLFFDRHGHLYVVDSFNQRVQRFSIE
ncbi:unnamed protein product [Rotaria sp. Silwood1]|nr:unnamed protein product [Rotaria sp. Silwood1]